MAVYRFHVNSCFVEGCLTIGENITRQCHSKVIVSDGGFTIACVNFMLFQRGGKKQHQHVYSCFFLPCCQIALNLDQAKLNAHYHLH